MFGLHERVGGCEIGGRMHQRPQCGHQCVVQLGDGEQPDHRHGGHVRRRTDGRGTTLRRRQRPTGAERRQIRLVQDDRGRSARSTDREPILGFECLGDHVHGDVRVGGIGGHRDAGTGQRRGHCRPPDPASTVHGNAHRRPGTPNNRRQPRIAALLSELRQDVDEDQAASMFLSRSSTMFYKFPRGSPVPHSRCWHLRRYAARGSCGRWG